MKTLNLGNNEQISKGITKTNTGFLAMTYTKSKEFKTLAGAQKWLQRHTA